jgi:hypothetical protein
VLAGEGSSQARLVSATIWPIDKMAGLMNDLVDPDGVTAEWLTEVLAGEGVLRSGSVVRCAAEPLPAMSFTGVFRRLELSYDVDEPLPICSAAAWILEFHRRGRQAALDHVAKLQTGAPIARECAPEGSQFSALLVLRARP